MMRSNYPRQWVTKALYPNTFAGFVAEYWETKPMLSKVPELYELSECVGALFEHDFADWGRVQLACADRNRQRWQDLSSEKPTQATFKRAKAQGDTLVLNDVDFSDPVVAEICDELQEVFNFPANANSYLTPPQSQGLALHFDTENVFVLQLAGEKKWRVFKPETPCPLIPIDISEALPERLALEITLTPGDLLYIPRGFPHLAWTQEQESLHLTFALAQLSWSSLLHRVVDVLAAETPELRRSLNPGFLEQGERIRLVAPKAFPLDVSLPNMDAAFAKTVACYLASFPRRITSEGCKMRAPATALNQ